MLFNNKCNINSMLQQNEEKRSLSSDGFKFNKKKSEENLRLKMGKKIGQLQNKAFFFQGQLHPYSEENKKLKENLTKLYKSVLFSSELLRNILPQQNNPSRKQKLQLAKIQEIAEMIKEDWQMMQEELRETKQKNGRQEQQIFMLQNKYELEVQKYEEKLLLLRQEKQKERIMLEDSIKNLEDQIVKNKEKAEEQKAKMKKGFEERLLKGEKLEEEFNKFKYVTQKREEDYEKKISYLKDQNKNNLEEFQASKVTLKEIYNKLLQDKLQEQKESYQFLLQAKEQQKMSIIADMTEQSNFLKDKISQKNTQLKYITGVSDQLKEMIGKIKDEIWEKNIKIDEFEKSIEKLNNNLTKQKEEKRIMSEQLEQKRQKLEKEEKNRKNYEEKYKKEKEEREKENDFQKRQLREEKLKWQQKLQISTKSLQDLRRKFRENDEKFEERLKKQKDRLEQIISEKKKSESQLKRQIERQKEQNKARLQEIQENKKIYEQQMKDLKGKYENEQTIMKNEYEGKINEIKSEFTQQITKINREHQRSLSEIQISNNQYIRKLVIDHNQKQIDSQKLFQQNEKKLRQNLRRYQTLQKEFADQIKSIQQQLEMNSKQKEELKKSHEEEMESMEKNMKKQKGDFQMLLMEQKKHLLDKMQDQIENFSKALQEKEELYEKKISLIKKEMMEEITLLKQSNCLDEIEERHLSEIKKLQAEKEEMMKLMQEKQEQKMKEQKQFYQQELLKQNEKFNEELAEISSKLELDLTQLNKQLLDEKQAHEFSKMKREEKITYLLDKIGDLKSQMYDKQTCILELQEKINIKNKELMSVEERIQERVKRVEEKFNEEKQLIIIDCSQKITTVTESCNTKIKQIQADRLNHASVMYQEFERMIKAHQQEINSISHRYAQLERLFEERPSRKEDLFKIKELISIKEKMDAEIKEREKKVREANQIVRYLNMELQNYKQIYDIFGPGGQHLSIRKNSSVDHHQIRGMISETPISEFSAKRLNTEGDQMRLPILFKNQTIVKAEDRQAPKAARLKKNIEDYLQKSSDLKSNASLFLKLLSSERKPVVEKNQTGRNLIPSKRRRKKGSLLIKDRKYIIKQKDQTLQKVEDN